jgi:hypothetical protein
MGKLLSKLLFAVLLVVSSPYAADDKKIVATDGQYIAYENGIVYDKKANIEWLAGPDKYVTWDDAKAWVENL